MSKTMCMFVTLTMVAMVTLQAKAQPAAEVPLRLVLPRPVFDGTPIDVRSPHIEAYRGDDVPPPPLLVPAGTRLLSRGRKVTSSDRQARLKDLELVTDGDKQYTPAAYLELAPGTQWVQVDLGESAEIDAVCIWRERPEQVIYRGTIVMASDDPAFKDGVIILFNNDYKNLAGVGAGADKEYFEDHFGKRIGGNGVRARYVRVYSSGNTSDPYNHYVEIEVHGR
ncbi:MAG: discoidin domain-containing protein [Kiritimatiellae bacterium]|nr:discoidin domain-containing protein [Kiritimatiellia bacterium]